MDEAAILKDVVDVATATARDHIVPLLLHSARERKLDGSIVTEADRAASSALVGALTTILDVPVVSEEMPADEQIANWNQAFERTADDRDTGANPSTSGCLWCIDPLDGTSNFANGLPFFAVSVALLREGRPVIGVVHAPMLRETYSARRGHGAYCNGIRLPLRRPAARLRDAIAGVDLKRLPAPLAARLAARPPYHSQRNVGSSAIELAYAAAGRYDVYLHGLQKLWDYAASVLLLTEAGGAVTALGGHDFWSQDPWQRSVVAATTEDLLLPWRDWIERAANAAQVPDGGLEASGSSR
ncbi:MAG TPA: inositol monophosphatase family protein [Burkholderiaceae bacterium]|nr:inositol monophosphatase family protein [Burkholderiaceae bacterium]